MALGHGRPKGLPKTGGRKKGVPNRSREFLVEIATKALGRAPIEELCAFYVSATEDTVKVSALKEICSYCYAKPKAVELSGPDGEQINPPMLAPTMDERLALIKALRKKD